MGGHGARSLHDAWCRGHGNLIKKGTQTFTVDAANRITNPGYSYDPSGNLTADPTYRYTYDAANRLIRVNKADGTLVADYTYDHRNLRTQKTIPTSTTRYHWDERNRLVRESDSGGATLARYIWDDTDRLVAIEKAGALYYTHTNQRGDILAITDTNNNRVATYTYGPWGELLAQTGTFDQPWRYANYYRDNETGLYYLQNRHYSPELGRFLAREPLHIDDCKDCGFAAYVDQAPFVSPYVYASNNPLSFTDPDGRNPRLAIAAAAILRQAVRWAFRLLRRGVTRAWTWIRGWRAKMEVHVAHHNFGWPWPPQLHGWRRHIHVLVYRKGVKGSARRAQIPFGRQYSRKQGRGH